MLLSLPQWLLLPSSPHSSLLRPNVGLTFPERLGLNPGYSDISLSHVCAYTTLAQCCLTCFCSYLFICGFSLNTVKGFKRASASFFLLKLNKADLGK